MNVLKRYTRFLFILALVGLFLSSTTVFARTYNLTILHTNDHHGHFMKFAPYPVFDVGGLAAQSTLVNIVRAEVEKAVRTALGDDVKVDFEFPDDIPVVRSGKHRYQICEIDQYDLQERQPELQS